MRLKVSGQAVKSLIRALFLVHRHKRHVRSLDRVISQNRPYTLSTFPGQKFRWSLAGMRSPSRIVIIKRLFQARSKEACLGRTPIQRDNHIGLRNPLRELSYEPDSDACFWRFREKMLCATENAWCDGPDTDGDMARKSPS